VPCRDVTERIEVVLDAGDSLRSYHLNKRTCGRAVGVASLLEDPLRGHAARDILACDPGEFLRDHPGADDLEEFLVLKHLFALQAALAVLEGEASGGPRALCAASELACDEAGEVTIRALIRVDLVTERIRSCGGCKT